MIFLNLILFVATCHRSSCYKLNDFHTKTTTTKPEHRMPPPSAQLVHLDSFTSKALHVSSLAITSKKLVTQGVHVASSSRPNSAIQNGVV